MIGIVIAAGYGTRLRPHTESIPKSLIELEHGISIIDYIMKVMGEVGIVEVYIATRGDLKDIFSTKVSSSRIVVVDVIPGDGNLWTLYQAIEKLKEMGIEDDIIVSMSDHVYESSILKNLIKASTRDRDRVLLCLDRSVRGEEAVEGLKVIIDGSAVVLAGKDIPPLTGIDTGLFYIPKKLFIEISNVVKEYGRSATLSNFINILARRGLVGFVDVTGLRWIDVDSVEDLAKARKIYWEIMRRNLIKDSDGIVARYINRRISTRISLFLYKNGIFVDPSIITALVFIIGIAGAVAAYLNMYTLGAILASLSSILDGVDGEVARLFNRQTEFGAILDTTLDRIVDTLLIAGLVYQGFILGIWPLRIEYIVLSFLALLGSIYVSFLSNLIRDRDFVVKARTSFPWPTRDVRIAVIALALIFKQPLLGLLYILFSSWYFIAKITILIVKGRRVLQGQSLVKFVKRAMPRPIIFTPVRIAIHDVVRDSLILILLIYTTALGLEYLHRYLAEDMPTIVWEVILVVELAVMIYFAYRVVRGLWYILISIKDFISKSLWMTTTVYMRVSIEMIILLTSIFIRYPINYCLAIIRAQRILIDITNYILNIFTILLAITIAIEFIKIIEHRIHSRISKLLKQ